MTNVIMMCGLPGSGKSTYVKEHKGEMDLYISRDLIRFSLLGEKEEYFGKETLVYNTFVDTINKALQTRVVKNIWVDATHPTPGSRYKLLRRIHGYKKLSIIVIDTPITTCLKQNAYREGREKVPDAVIWDMNKSFQKPTFKEGYDEIITIDIYGNKSIKRR